MKDIVIFIRHLVFLLFKQTKEIFSLTRLFFRLLRYDVKTAFSILYFSTESLYSANYYNTKFSNQRFNANYNLAENRKKLFILGSGPSVNKISELEWNYIKTHDSWGFNLWFCHDFIPNSYFAQTVLKSNVDSLVPSKLDSLLAKMLMDKKEEYSEVEIYTRGDAINNRTFYTTNLGSTIKSLYPNKVKHLSEMNVSSKSSIDPILLLKEINECGFFKKKNRIQLIPKFGSTITELISFALIQGYKEIILCGVDMNDGGHFYDSEDYFLKYPYLKELYDVNHNRTKTGDHEHMDKSQRPYTIKEYIVAIRNFALENFDANIYVMSSESTLYPEIKKFEI